MRINYSRKTDVKWQKIWEESGIYRFQPDSAKEKLYLMEMFSYPSGAKLHIGHWWNFGIPDIWGRMKRMQGYQVFHPMGFDAFGLPAENYAITSGIHPKTSTEENIRTMEEQLKTIGATYDWDYEIKTCEPEYYRWTQWLFLQLYHRGLAYQKKAPVNWCPSCQTVLANEQAKNGECDRCGSKVIQKDLTQWFFRITEYAEELLSGLDSLDWPEKTKAIQRNWIGKSKGAEVMFEIEGCEEKLPVYTTRVDTLMGVTYLVMAPEHSLIPAITSEKQRKEVEEYQKAAALLTELDRTSAMKEKTGVFTGAMGIHPLTGRKIPIWISDYVIASYGTGAVMAVPAHDTRDYEFAVKYQLPILQVIERSKGGERLPLTGAGILVNSGKFTGLSSEKAGEKITADLSLRQAGASRTNYRLRDWLVSRQRYWGAPIPIVYCEKCGVVPVPEEKLPVTLPFEVDFIPGGESPLAGNKEFTDTVCPCCGGAAKRETDTLDTFVCSSWYYLRYLDPHNQKAPWDIEKARQFMPIDKYVGGIEHAAMHLLYARFIYKALRDMGFVEGSEPFRSLVHQGIILGPDGQKMSKSRGNTISPDGYIEEYGSDVFRTYLSFGFSYQEGGTWKDNGIKAVKDFFDRITRMVENFQERKKETGMKGRNYEEGFDEKIDRMQHRAIKAVTQELEKFQFNTAIARLMEFRRVIVEYQSEKKESTAFEFKLITCFIKLFAPFAPHFTEEMWEELGMKGSVFDSSWPVFDNSKAEGDAVEIVVQINSKNRCKISIGSHETEEAIKMQALNQKEIIAELEGRTVRRIIYVKARLINIVVS